MKVKKFGDLAPGDIILGPSGPVRVAEAYPEHIPETMWEIESEDGSIIKASGNHLWYCETLLDWELHNLRKIDGKRLLRNLSEKTLTFLEATANNEETIETRLIDMIGLLQAADNQELVNLIVRVAESIGHISENTTTYEDFGYGDTLEEVIRGYDARSFAAQILALTGKRKYRKTKLIVGSILTTDAMMELSETVDLPVVKMK